MLENFFRRGEKEVSKKPAHDDMEPDKMVGEIHSADYIKGYEKAGKEVEVYFKDLGFQKGDKVEVRRVDNSGFVEGVIFGFDSIVAYTPDPEYHFVAKARSVDESEFSIYVKDIRAGRVKKL